RRGETLARHRRGVRTAGILLTLAATWVWAAPAPGQPGTASGDDAAAAAAPQAQVATETTGLVGDFNGDRRKDLFWYGPGARPDHLWLGRSDRNFTGVPVSVTRSYQPLIGDFNGDGRSDIFWYGPGAAVDRLWLGQPRGRFAGRTVSVVGTYRPFLGDFNGDRRSDIFWYGPGAAKDRLWLGRAGGAFAGVAVNVNGTYRPLVGNFDGDGRRDIYWYAPGAHPDYVWYGGSSGRFSQVKTAITRSYRPLVGDFGGDARDDVIWWAAGTGDDVLASGTASRGFVTRRTTIDLAYARALPLQPATIAEQYNPYGFVAHAFGSIDGRTYTNSLEAFQRNYARGFRVFEVDHVLLADGTALAAHDHSEHNYGLTKPFKESTWADIVRAGRKYVGRYTVLRSQDVLRLMVDHPDIYIIGDFKYSRTELLKAYVRQAKAMGRPRLIERVFPHVAHQEELDADRAWYPLRNYVLALYMTQGKGRYEDWKTIDFVRRNRAPAVMMWWRDRDPSISLIENAHQGRRYRKSFTDGLEAAGAVPYVHSIGDPVQVQRFWDLGIPVYSDEPFPPLASTAATLKAPTFSNADGMPPA
ncbi:MAG: FG-GAP-like repeat-containing protein, partial [Actinomycetes bacterium]